jgi:hypothetical protein
MMKDFDLDNLPEPVQRAMSDRVTKHDLAVAVCLIRDDPKYRELLMTALAGERRSPLVESIAALMECI